MHRTVLTISVLCVLLVAAVLASAMIGQYAISGSDVVRSFFAYFGLGTYPENPVIASTLWQIRFPRVILGVLVGAGLAMAGTLMQAVFSNPLAEPGIVGVSAGSAVGASVALVFAPGLLAGFSVPLAAFVGGMCAAFAAYFLSRSGGRAEVVTLVLVGIAITAVGNALTSAFTFVAPTSARDQIVFWQLGSLAGATWVQVSTVAAVMCVASVGVAVIARKLDVLALGDRAAEHVGINVQGLRCGAIALAALFTSAAVAYAGIIAFVGLIVPHLLRLILGPRNRILLPATALGGAVLITLADLAARTIVPFADLPIGIFTALVGGPTFFALLKVKLHLGGTRG